LGIRGLDDDIIIVNAFVADADVLGLAHKEQKLPPTKQEAMDVLNSLPKKPSVIIDSGYGLYMQINFRDLLHRMSLIMESRMQKNLARELTLQKQLLS